MVKNMQHRMPSYPTLHYPPAHTRSHTTSNNHDPTPSCTHSKHHLPPTSHTSHTNATEHTPSPLIDYLRPPPWPDPNIHNQIPVIHLPHLQPDFVPYPGPTKCPIGIYINTATTNIPWPRQLTTLSRPPPWPIIATPPLISFTPRSRPPPWPIISVRTTRTLRTIKTPTLRTILHKYSKRTKFSSDSHPYLHIYP